MPTRNPSDIEARKSSLTLRSKIFLAFGGAIAVMAVLAIQSIIGFVNVSDDIDAIGRTTAAVTTAHAVDRHVHAVDQMITVYDFTGDPDIVVRVKETRAALNDALDRALTDMGAEEKPTLETIRGELDDYFAAFDEVVAGKTESARMIADQILPQGADIANRLQSMTVPSMGTDANASGLASRLLQRFQSFRLLAERAVVHFDEARDAEATKASKGMASILNAFKTRAADAFNGGGDLVTAVDAYGETFARHQEVAAKVERIRAERMAPLRDSITAALTTLSDRKLSAQSVRQSQSVAGVDRTMTIVLVMAVVSVAVGSAVALIIGRDVSGGIARMTATMRRLAEGARDVEIAFLSRGDELGTMAAALSVFKETAIEVDRLAAEERALSETREERRRRVEAEIAKFDHRMSETLTQLLEVSDALAGVSNQIGASVERTSGLADSATSTSTMALDSVRHVDSSAGEMASSLDEITRQVAISTEVAARAVDDAEQAGERMERLRDAATRIGAVTEVINKIASQTNLLALNATIEAARAGEAGKGFSVVAAEVKSLADQTAKATDDIADQVGAIQTTTAGAADAIHNISETLRRIDGIVNEIAAAVTRQSEATREISRHVAEAATGSQAVVESMSQVTTAAAGTRRVAEQLMRTSSTLSDRSGAIRQDVDGFMRAING